MREKKIQTIVSFSSTSQAIAAELFLKEKKLVGRLIPVPKEIEAGCGMAFLCKEGTVEEIRELLETNGIGYKNVMDILH